MPLAPFDPLSGVLTVGLLADGSPARICLRNQSGVVIGGLPGSGKTVAATLIATELILAGAHLTIIDGKGGTDWETIAEYAARSTGDDLDIAHSELLSVNDSMRSRLSSMRQDYGSSNYWNINPEKRPPLEVVIIDECQTFFDLKSVLGGKAEKDKAAQILAAATNIVKKGRSAGYILFALTQKPTADSLPTALRDNCGVRVCFRVMTDESAKAVLGTIPDGAPSPVKIPEERRGGAVIALASGALTECRFANLPEDIAARILADATYK